MPSLILAAGMIAVNVRRQGLRCRLPRHRIQREGKLVHLVARHLRGLSADIAGVGDRDGSFPLPGRRGGEFHHGSSGTDPRSLPPKPRDACVPDLHIDSTKLKTRDFRWPASPRSGALAKTGYRNTMLFQ
jgi:error-prone DNA polymerase